MIKNALQSNHLIDWLKLTSSQQDLSQKTPYLTYLEQESEIFLSQLISILENKLGTVFQKIDDVSHQLNLDHSYRQVPFSNLNLRLNGSIPLLLSRRHASQLGIRFKDGESLIPVEISSRKLETSKKDGHLLNEFLYLKSRLFVYSQIVHSSTGLIIGRNSSNKDDCEIHVLDFKEKDKDIVLRMGQVLEWIRDLSVSSRVLRSETFKKRHADQLLPNLCVPHDEEDHFLFEERDREAEKMNDVTMLWNCGVAQRKKARTHGVMGWRDHGCSSDTLGFSPDSRSSRVIDAILEVNRSDENNTKEEIKMIPPQIKTNLFDWRRDGIKEAFMDVETIPVNSESLVYLVGIVFENQYFSWMCQEITKEEEGKILKGVEDFLKSRGIEKIWYWYAEKGILGKKMTVSTHPSQEDTPRWCDMCSIFREEPIAIKGCFGFGLKKISSAMKKWGMISTSLESECKSGLSSLSSAVKFYGLCGPKVEKEGQDLLRYNEFDCRVLAEILDYLRKHR